MSRIGSTSGVRVAAQPLSNVYTVLLLLALLAMVFMLAFVLYILQTRYGNLGYGEAVERSLDRARSRNATLAAGVEEEARALENFPAGVGAGAGPGAPPTPTPPEQPPVGT